MADGHADQGIEFGRFVEEALPVGELVADEAFALWRRVDALAGRIVHQGGARCVADVDVGALDGLADFDGGAGGQRALSEGGEPLAQCGTVA